MTINLSKIFKLNKKIFINICFSVFFILIVTFCIIIPSINDIKEIKDKINDQRIDLEKKYLKGQNLKNVSEKISEIEDDIKIIDSIFVSNDDGLGFITKLEEVAESNMVNQKINLLQGDTENDFYKEIPMQFLVEGNIINLTNYLLGLESLDYYVNIDLLRIEKLSAKEKDNGEEKGKVILKMLINASTYWKK